MLRFVAVLAVFVLTVYTVIDCVQTDGERVKGLPKILWVFVVVAVPVLGALAWWTAGRPSAAISTTATTTTTGRGRSGPIGPDDDPDFLRRL